MMRRCSPALVPLARMHHISIIVPRERNIEKAVGFANIFNGKVTGPAENAENAVKAMWLDLPNTQVEFLQPLGNNEVLDKYLKRNPKGGLHHLCFEVASIEKAISVCEQHKVHVVGTPKKRARGKLSIFLHPKATGGVLIQLQEA